MAVESEAPPMFIVSTPSSRHSKCDVQGTSYAGMVPARAIQNRSSIVHLTTCLKSLKMSATVQARHPKRRRRNLGETTWLCLSGGVLRAGNLFWTYLAHDGGRRQFEDATLLSSRRERHKHVSLGSRAWCETLQHLVSSTSPAWGVPVHDEERWAASQLRSAPNRQRASSRSPFLPVPSPPP